jgi:Arc/MetJ family transcription regulator
MRTTLNLDEQLIKRAAELTGRSEKSTLVRMGLEALIIRESSRRLASLGGTDPNASAASRHRPRA